ncbi:hypothetical protein B0H13DRAFT_1881398 [Mycena leptocephala]|nr:hypothetical protein B0H13DRAFT_1881398 [Mycena leptocephala]
MYSISMMNMIYVESGNWGDSRSTWGILDSWSTVTGREIIGRVTNHVRGWAGGLPAVGGLDGGERTLWSGIRIRAAGAHWEDDKRRGGDPIYEVGLEDWVVSVIGGLLLYSFWVGKPFVNQTINHHVWIDLTKKGNSSNTPYPQQSHH